jgi:ribonuclease HII
MPALLSCFSENLTEAGCDEAGRGCYAGPVFAAAVILPNDFYHPLLNDSKQVKAQDRQSLRQYIETHALAFAVAQSTVDEIDQYNILKASFMAMHRAIDFLKKKPELLLIDGNRFLKYSSIPHQCIIKGDGKFASIAAASILAKTYRDEYMTVLHREYPQYDWEANKGYGTAAHRAALVQHGLTPHHRQSFRLLPTQSVLF